MNENYMHSELTGQIIQAAHNVYNYFGGRGFSETVYEGTLLIELSLMGLDVKSQCPISVFYKGDNVGDFRADLIVNNLVIIELKAVLDIHPMHEVQLVNYLRATEIEVGLLINFGAIDKIQKKRKVFLNSRKKGRLEPKFDQ